MPKIFTTPEAEQRARLHIHYLMIAGGLQTSRSGESLPWPFGATTRYARYSDGAIKACNELVNRDFENIDSALYDIANNQPRIGGGKTYKPADFAKMLVYAADLVNIYWDDTLKTPYEIDEFKKTLLGQAVYKYGKYISAIPDRKSGTSRASSATTGGSAQPRATGQPPQNNYKQSGPQSANVRDLQDGQGGVGTPGQKFTAGGSYIFRIIGDNPQSKNIPNVFIKPLSPSGATGNTNKIFISSGNGYTDCTCYFDDQNDAQAFLDKIIAAGRVPSNVSNMRVVKKPADKNGYFLVGTEFGLCAVSAKTLNEALTESAKAKDDYAGGWEKATEGYTKEELEELHTWMRRD